MFPEGRHCALPSVRPGPAPQSEEASACTGHMLETHMQQGTRGRGREEEEEVEEEEGSRREVKDV